MTKDERDRRRHNIIRNGLIIGGTGAAIAGLKPGMAHNNRMIQAGAALAAVAAKQHYDDKIIRNDIRNKRTPHRNKEVEDGKKKARIGYGLAAAGTIAGFHKHIAEGSKTIKYIHAGLTAAALGYGAYGQVKHNNNS